MKRSAYGLSTPTVDRLWELRALCATSDDPDQWIVNGHVNGANLRAMRLCGRCPVLAECAAAVVPELHEDTVRAGSVVRSRRDAKLRRAGEEASKRQAERAGDLNSFPCPGCDGYFYPVKGAIPRHHPWRQGALLAGWCPGWDLPPLQRPTDTGACGEPRGYDRHRRDGERPCERCKRAKREANRARALSDTGEGR